MARTSVRNVVRIVVNLSALLLQPTVLIDSSRDVLLHDHALGSNLVELRDGREFGEFLRAEVLF